MDLLKGVLDQNKYKMNQIFFLISAFLVGCFSQEIAKGINQLHLFFVTIFITFYL